MELKRIIAYNDKKFNFNMDKIRSNTRKIYLMLLVWNWCHFYGDLMYLQKLLVTKQGETNVWSRITSLWKSH